MPRIIALLLTITSVTFACAKFPELETARTNASRDSAWPTLLPINEILAQSPNSLESSENASRLQSTAGGLKARAAALRNRQIIEPATRSRMTRALARRS